MNILYISTVMPIPIRDIVEGKTEITGWPAYYFPMYRLMRLGHNIDFAFVSEKTNYNIKVDWFKKEQIVINVYKDADKISKWGSFHRKAYILGLYIKYYKLVAGLMKEKHYDFVYCQVDGIIGNLLANFYKIPCGMRLYGDILIKGDKIYTRHEYIEKHGKALFALKNPVIYLEYRIKKKFLLVTDDGADADKTYELLKPSNSPYKFLFWRSGVDKSPIQENPRIQKMAEETPYIAYPNRVDYPKRQDRAIEVLKILHNKGYKLHLYLIGHTHNEKYYSDLKGMIANYNLEKYVHFLGNVSQNDMKTYAKHAVANVLVGDISNRGNVFYELMSVGAPVIALEEESLHKYISNFNSGFLANNVDEIANYVCMLIEKRNLRKTICNGAYESAKVNILSEEERFQEEVDLILAAAGDGNVDKFSERL